MAHPTIKLLTGIPRSGTTLCCHLLNEIPNTVALHEPISPDLFSADGDPVKLVDETLARFRRRLLHEGRAASKQLGGRVPSNPVSIKGERDRKEIVSLGDIVIDKPLDNDFVLAVKHNALFSALVSELEQRYEMFCIVRNPLAVLASWQSVDLPVSNGSLPMGEKFDPKLSRELAEAKSVSDRQLRILGWFFGIFRNKRQILTYEDVISSNGAVLQTIAGQPITPLSSLTFQTHSGSSSSRLVEIADLLLNHPDVYEPFYTRDDIEQQLEEMLD